MQGQDRHRSTPPPSTSRTTIPCQADRLSLPAKITGAIDGTTAAGPDSDFFRFAATAGEQWVFEVDAARSQSKLDSYLEIFDSQGGHVPRVLFQASRDSYFTFRGKNDSDSDDFRVFNWDEMHINDYLYAGGEVVKFWLFPRGPDRLRRLSRPRKSVGLFRHHAAGDAFGEPCYVVTPHPPGTRLVANGLPVFSLNFENDDDAHRELGKDSRLHFTAPADGEYVVKIEDMRGFQGPAFRYALTVREQRPDFKVSLVGTDPLVAWRSAKVQGVRAANRRF